MVGHAHISNQHNKCCECGWTCDHRKPQGCETQHAAHVAALASPEPDFGTHESVMAGLDKINEHNAALASQVPAQPPSSREYSWFCRCYNKTHPASIPQDSSPATDANLEQRCLEFAQTFFHQWIDLVHDYQPLMRPEQFHNALQRDMVAFIRTHKLWHERMAEALAPAPASPQSEGLEQESREVAKRMDPKDYFFDAASLEIVARGFADFIRTKLRAALAESDKRARAEALEEAARLANDSTDCRLYEDHTHMGSLCPNCIAMRIRDIQ
jgi:hypothetical protein